MEEDPHEFNEGNLECTVSRPQKENDGTKDAFVSYLVTTNVSFLPAYRRVMPASQLQASRQTISPWPALLALSMANTAQV